MPIRQLSPDVAAKIAAGEVVERPASVVKELVENAIDAGARQVRVDLQDGGLGLIRVVDDGSGVPSAELPLTFARHATSKIGGLADLERLHTLGFRGEALASIAAVARVSITSRPAAATAGARIAAEGGVPGSVEPAGAPAGTSVSVRDLFAEVPARFKFLKSRATETGHCLHFLEQCALAYPEIRFTATSEGRQVFATPGDGRLHSAIVAVYGLRVADEMIPFGGVSDDTGQDGAPMAARAHALALDPTDPPRVDGYTSRPTTFKSTRQYLSFFVNRRWVQSRALTYAVEEAYHSLLLAGRHPIAVVNIALHPSLLDVNVHPAKTEIKFLRERQVYAAVQRAVRAAVVAAAGPPEVSASAFAVPGWAPAPNGAYSDPEAAESPFANGSPFAPGSLAAGRLWPGAPTGADASAGGGLARGAAGGFAVPGADPEAPVGGTSLPVLRVLGQVSQAYIVTEGPDGVYLIDQHAAHERILLERMVAEWRAQDVGSQLLLEPLPVDLGPAEREAVEEHLDHLRGLGFDLEPFGPDTLLVRAVPAVLSAHARAESLRDLLVELAGGDGDAARHGETWEEHALANVACKAAIKAGQVLSPEEQRALIRQLEGADARQSCCHGRPTMVHLSLDALARQFDRR